jgi:hypothetical protein
MSMQDFFDKCETKVDLSHNFNIEWSFAGTGFGSFRFYNGEDGKLHISNECCSKTFIKQILCLMVEEAVLDDSKNEQ